MRWRSSSNPARLHMARLIIFKRLICPSTGPVLQGNDNAARTAARSRVSPPANPARADSFAASSHPSSRSAFRVLPHSRCRQQVCEYRKPLSKRPLSGPSAPAAEVNALGEQSLGNSQPCQLLAGRLRARPAPRMRKDRSPVSPDNVVKQAPVLNGMLAFRPGPPGIVAGSRDAQHPAKLLDWPGIAAVLDHAEPHLSGSAPRNRTQRSPYCATASFGMRTPAFEMALANASISGASLCSGMVGMRS
jgi:hypothetical protein